MSGGEQRGWPQTQRQGRDLHRRRVLGQSRPRRLWRYSVFGDHRREIKGGEANTTNNRMELMAAIAALEALKRPCAVELHTDSQYLRLGITQWLANWKRNGWRTAARQAVKNDDLWKRLDEAARRHRIEWRWVKGHAGHDENERADALAQEGLREVKP